MKYLFCLAALIAGFGWAATHSASAQTLTPLHTFTGPASGAYPIAGVTAADGTLYGVAQSGGSAGNGVVFAVGTNGTGFTILHNFSAMTASTNSDGATPDGSLILSGGTLYGTTAWGGAGGAGSVFRINADGTGFTNLYSFSATDSTTATNNDGANPYGSLILSGSTLYGMADEGGTGADGTVFAIHLDGTGFTNLYNFSAKVGSVNSDGAQPFGGLVLSGGVLYGGTQTGGASGAGTVFAVNTDGTGFTNLHSFTSTDGNAADGSLVLSGGTLYGTTDGGGSARNGTVFALNTDGSGFTNLHIFSSLASSQNTNSDGATPFAGLLLSGGVLYGTTHAGGNAGFGVVFAVSTDGTGFTNLYSFTSTDGNGPFASLTLSDGILFGTTQIGGLAGNGTVFSINPDGSGFSSLYTFPPNSDGTSPQAGLVRSGNTLYGAAQSGGSYGNGTLFKVSADGSGFTTLHEFTSSDGITPNGDLTLSGSTLYGAMANGSVARGTIFAVNTDGSGFTNLHRFSALTFVTSSKYTNADGAYPNGGLVQFGSMLYGTAASGGAGGHGTLFAVNTDGSYFTNLYNFTAYRRGNTNSDGASPNAGLVLSGSTLYGTALSGGTKGNGTVFKINTDGTGFTNLHNFTALVGGTNSDGVQPYNALVVSGSTLYGVAYTGGNFGVGTVFKVNTDGSGFMTLHSFTALVGALYTNNDGAYPYAPLLISGNTLYGTANGGGMFGGGTVFAVNTDGSGFTTLYHFSYGNDGGSPAAGLLLSSNILYGTAQYGGMANAGTVFSLALLPPKLAITGSGTNVVLNWSNTSAGFTLESTPSLASPAVWSPVSPAPQIVNGQNCVTNSTASQQLFYQLSQ